VSVMGGPVSRRVVFGRTGDGLCAQARQELGVYLLGAIEPAQRALVDRHLAACAQCRAELAGLAGLPSLLRRVPAEEAWQLPPDTTTLTAGPLLAELAGQVSGIRRRRWRLTAAAALMAGLAVTCGLLGLHAVVARPQAPAAVQWAVTAQGTNPVTGAWAAVRYTPLPWGTELEVQVTGIAAGTRCQLQVTGPHGQDLAAGSWTITAGHLAAWYPASVSFQDTSVRGFEVTADGKILVTVKAP
jgi:predicted anti-sigma-YlaC factor YlaD